MKAIGWRLSRAAVLAGVLALAAGGAPPAVAQDAPARGRPGGPAGKGPGGPPTADEMREVMEQLMIVRMKKALQLTPRQEGLVIPRVQEMLDARRGFAARRRASVARLRALILDENADDKEIAAALKEVHAIEREFRQREGELRASIDGDLTPGQQARLLFFEDRFRRAMQQRLREGAGGPPGARRRAGAEGGRPPGAGPGPSPPDEDPLDDPGSWEDEP